MMNSKLFVGTQGIKTHVLPNKSSTISTEVHSHRIKSNSMVMSYFLVSAGVTEFDYL